MQKNTYTLKKLSSEEKLKMVADVMDWIGKMNLEFHDKLHDYLLTLPDYFWVAPASTGKYHNEAQCTEGGLVQHTLANIHIAFDLFRIGYWEFTDKEKLDIVTALLLHDSYKFPDTLQNLFEDLQVGDSVETTIPSSVFAHPIIAAKKYLEAFPDGTTVATGIATHMGRWNKWWGEDMELPLPETKMQKFIHLCDFLGSRKDINVLTDVPFEK